MTRDECDALVADLERIGVEVRRVQQNQQTGSWEVVYWHKGWRVESTITNAKGFRRVVHKGLSGSFPKGALDFPRTPSDKPTLRDA